MNRPVVNNFTRENNMNDISFKQEYQGTFVISEQDKFLYDSAKFTILSGIKEF